MALSAAVARSGALTMEFRSRGLHRNDAARCGCKWFMCSTVLSQGTKTRPVLGAPAPGGAQDGRWLSEDVYAGHLTNYIARSLLETGGFRPLQHPRL